MIVDYANVFASLEKALAIYGPGGGGGKPVRDKKKLVADLRKAVDAAVMFCANRGVALAAIEQLPVGSMQRLQGIDDAVNALISPDSLRREFFGHERIVTTLYRAVKPDPSALEFSGRVACLVAIGDAIRTKLNPNPVDISAVMGDINKLLDESIERVAMREKAVPVMDLSKIDFKALAKRFKESKHKNTDLEVLKAAIRAQLEKLMRLNKTRADFQQKFEELIDSYNAGSRNIEERAFTRWRGSKVEALGFGCGQSKAGSFGNQLAFTLGDQRQNADGESVGVRAVATDEIRAAVWKADQNRDQNKWRISGFTTGMLFAIIGLVRLV
jgi:type I restriction enzyme, R subunit